MIKNINEIKLGSDSEFSQRFNYVSDLYAKAEKENTKEAWQEYLDAKLALEQGYPIPEGLAIDKTKVPEQNQ